MECSICLQLPQNSQTVPCCLNIFCVQCLQNWVQIKNFCPLCNKLLGQKAHNSLKKQENSEQFDNGLLYFENELATITKRIQYFQGRLNVWHRQSKNFKSHISSSHLRFVDDQLQLAQEYLAMMTIAIQSSDRQNGTLYSQLLTQLLNSVGEAFQGKSISKYQNDVEDDYFYEQIQEEQYVPCYTIRQSGNKNKQRKGKKQLNPSKKNIGSDKTMCE